MSTSAHLRPVERHILVVDDESADVDLVQEAIGIRPIRLHVAGTVSDAVRFLERSSLGEVPVPHLILLDVRLPILPGTALLEERHRRGLWRDLPIVVYSSTEHERERCLELGANDFIRKPAVWDDWHRTMNELVARWLP